MYKIAKLAIFFSHIRKNLEKLHQVTGDHEREEYKYVYVCVIQTVILVFQNHS